MTVNPTGSSAAQHHTDKASDHTHKAMKEAHDTASHTSQAMSHAAQAVKHHCVTACQHSSNMVADSTGKMSHHCNKMCHHAKECATGKQGILSRITNMFRSSTPSMKSTTGMTSSKGMMNKMRNMIQQRPMLFTSMLMMMSFWTPFFLSTIGFGGLMAGKGLFSSMRYDSWSYKRGSSEAHAHQMLDDNIDQYKHQQSSYLNRMIPGIDVDQYFGTSQRFSDKDIQNMVRQSLQQSDAHGGQGGYLQSLMHPFGGSSSYGQQQGYGHQGGMMTSLLHPFSGSSNQYSNDDSSSWMSTMGKTGMMAKMMPSSLKPNMFSSQQQDQSSYIPSMFGGQSSSQYGQYMPSMISSSTSSLKDFFNPFTYWPWRMFLKPKTTVDYNELNRLQNLLSQAQYRSQQRL